MRDFEGKRIDATRAVQGYQGTWYDGMNSQLRGTAKRDFYDVPIDLMRQAIDAAPVNRESFVAFRGLSGDVAELFMTAKPGDVLPDAGFMSMSYREATAKYFHYSTKNVTFEIIVPEGTKGIDMSGFFWNENSINLERVVYTEREFVAQAGSRLEVLEVDTENRRIKAVLKQNG